jgi:preprotein translocase subunit YajC
MALLMLIIATITFVLIIIRKIKRRQRLTNDMMEMRTIYGMDNQV